LRAGAVEFLYKPFSEAVLLGAIQSALQASRDGGAGTPC
jgi:FixJ family two-component response regulator